MSVASSIYTTTSSQRGGDPEGIIASDTYSEVSSLSSYETAPFSTTAATTTAGATTATGSSSSSAADTDVAVADPSSLAMVARRSHQRRERAPDAPPSPGSGAALRRATFSAHDRAARAPDSNTTNQDILDQLRRSEASLAVDAAAVAAATTNIQQTEKETGSCGPAAGAAATKQTSSICQEHKKGRDCFPKTTATTTTLAVAHFAAKRITATQYDSHCDTHTRPQQQRHYRESARLYTGHCRRP